MVTSPSLRTAGQGFLWSFSASSLALAVSLSAQILLGWFLSEDDFGTYAIAIAFSNFAAVFREGGITRWLVRQSPAEFVRHAAAAQKLSYSLATVAATMLLLVAVLAGWVYESPRITQLLLVLAAAFPPTAYNTVARAQLTVRLKFRDLAVLRTVNDLLRHLLVVLLAAWGWGALSFALPVVVASCTEFGALRLWTRLPVFLPEFWHQHGATVFRACRWSMFGSLAAAVLRNGDYAMLGLVAPAAIVGVYYFAFQLTLQPVLLVSESMRRVLLPVFARLDGQPRRQAQALRYAGLFVGVVAGPGFVLLAVLAAPLIALLWGDRWLDAVVPMQVLAIAMVFHLTAFVAEIITQARGQFRMWTAAVLVRGCGLGLVALSAPLWGGNVDTSAVAVVMGGYLMISAIVEVAVLLRALRLHTSSLWQPMGGPLALTLVAVAVALLVDQQLHGWHNAVRCGAMAACYGLTFLGLLAVCCRPVLREFWDISARIFHSRRTLTESSSRRGLEIAEDRA